MDAQAEIIQGSPEWHAIRLGKLTASRVADATARTKTGWGASRANYMAELLVERLTGRATESYMNAAMQWGTDQEPIARATYEFMADCTVETVGFVDHPTIAMAGCSPDGFVGEDGMVEFKCPNTATHIDTLLGESVDGKYIKQMQWQMACTGRKWCTFVSFDPRLPASMQMFMKQVDRDDTMIATLEKEAREFLAELAEKERQLRVRYASDEAAAA